MGIRSALYLPKEHGSWGMFFIPLALGVVAGGRWSSSVVLFVAVSFAAFLAREPFMTAWAAWRRGSVPGRSRRAAAMYIGTAVLAGAALLPAYPWLVLPAVLGGAMYCWHAEAALRGERRSATIELLAIATSMLVAPAAYYVSSGRLDETAMLLWLLCFAYFASSVFYVRMRLTWARARVTAAAARRHCLIYHVILTAVLAGLTLHLSPVVLAGFVPILARAFYYVARPSANLNLKQIGWTEVVYSLVFLACAAMPVCATCLRT